MKNAEIKGLSEIELKEKIGSEQEALRKMRFAHQISAIENPMKVPTKFPLKFTASNARRAQYPKAKAKSDSKTIILMIPLEVAPQMDAAAG